MKMVPMRTGRSFIGFRWMECRKQFAATPSGWRSFWAERRAAELFREYDWMSSWRDWGVSGRGRPWFETERFHKSQRLDMVCRTATAEQKRDYARKALSVALDLYEAGWAHRDLKTANFFVRDDGGLVLKDFETLCRYPAKKPSFFGSYDLTGRGLPSPFRTAHQGFFAERPDALGAMLGVGPEEAAELLEELLRGEYVDGSATFRRKLTRHVSKTGLPYASLRLRFLEIGPGEAQRDTEKRLAKLGMGAASLAGKTVVEFGCHCGGMLMAIQRFRPGACLGVEIDEGKVATARRMAAFENFQNMEFRCGDVDFVKPEDLGGPRDVVLCLALERHVKHRGRLFWLLGQMCRETLYLEGNPGSDAEEIRERLQTAGFESIEYRGLGEDDVRPENNQRPVFVARKAGAVSAAGAVSVPARQAEGGGEELRVSVVVRVLGGGEGLEESVLSALAQPETGEVLLMENEGVAGKAGPLAEGHARVKRISLKGACTGSGWLEQGIRTAGCPYVSFLQAGDVYLPGRFAGARAVWAEHPEADGVHEGVETLLPARETGLWAGRERRRRVGVPGRVAPEDLFGLLMEGGNGRIYLEGIVAKRESLERAGFAGQGAEMEGEEGGPGDLVWLKMAARGRLYSGGGAGAVAEQRVPMGGVARDRKAVPRREASMRMWREMVVWLAREGFGAEVVRSAARRHLEEVGLCVQGLRLWRANRVAAGACRFLLRHPECRCEGMGALAADAILPVLFLRRAGDALWDLARGRLRPWKKFRERFRKPGQAGAP